MNRFIVIVAVVSLAVSCVTNAGEEPADDDLKTSDAKFSYALGMEIGTNLEKLPAEIDLAAFLDGVKCAIDGTEPKLSKKEAADVKQEYFMKMQKQRNAEMEKQGAAAQKAGEEFLAANGKKEGVTTTDSGLQYTVIKEGQGATPKPTDTVTVHYRGTLLDGTVFDSSYKRGEPATFPVKGVIKGWTEALQLMNVGGKCKVFVPSDLAYGERGAGQTIPPYATLIFDIELLGIEE